MLQMDLLFQAFRPYLFINIITTIYKINKYGHFKFCSKRQQGNTANAQISQPGNWNVHTGQSPPYGRHN